MHYPKGFGIQSVISHGPSDGVLKPGDEFVAVGGRPANTPAKLQAVLAAERPGRTVPVVVNRQTSPTSRNAVPTTVDVTLGKPSGNRKGALLGVRVVSGCLAPFTVDLGLGNQIGGPSAGMMFALGIIDKVGLLGNLTGGRFVAGTGTIDPNGKVGPIGGISLKMIAARRKGATVFLAPAANCADVRKDTPGGLQVIKVATLHQAVDDLHALQSGKSVPGC
jgi:PDZ domain-containing protein